MSEAQAQAQEGDGRQKDVDIEFFLCSQKNKNHIIVQQIKETPILPK